MDGVNDIRSYYSGNPTDQPVKHRFVTRDEMRESLDLLVDCLSKIDYNKTNDVYIKLIETIDKIKEKLGIND